jgi:lipopolysaccharide/colanic/teichoic acid biosynthesis glycosyltransferase
MWKAVLNDRGVSYLVGFFGLFLLCPLIVVIALLIRCSSHGALAERYWLPDDDRRSVLVFACDGSLGNFLRRTSLRGLPAVISLILGEVTVLELLRLDWGE